MPPNLVKYKLWRIVAIRLDMTSNNVKLRRHGRLAHRLPTNFVFSGQLIEGFAVNFSESGLLILSPSLAEIGTLLHFFVKTEAGDLSLHGRVVLHQPNVNRPDSVQLRGMGIELIDAPKAYFQLLEDLRRRQLQNATLATKRYPANRRVRIKLGNVYLGERIENLSQGGAFIITKQAFEVGDEVVMTMTLPGRERPFVLESTIRHRVDEGQSERTGRPCGIGVEFSALSRETAAYLKHYLKRLDVYRDQNRAKHLEGVPLVGSLEDYLISEILLELYYRGLTGVLELKHDDVVKKVYFCDGRPVYVESSVRTETLGHFLLRHGYITEKHLYESFEDLKSGNLFHGEILLRRGFIDQTTLSIALSRHNEEKLANTFSWFYGDFQFSANSTWPSSISVFPMRLFEVISEGIGRWFNQSIVGEWLGLEPESVVRLRAGVPTDEFIPVHAQKALMVLREPTKIADLSEMIGLTSDAALPLVFLLIHLGWVEVYDFNADDVEGGPKGLALSRKMSKGKEAQLEGKLNREFARLSSLSYYDILGVQTPLMPDQLRKQFVEFMGRYPLETLMQIHNPKVRARFCEVRLWIRTAFETLSRPTLRRVYDQMGVIASRHDRHRDEVEIELGIQHALASLRSKKPKHAVSILKTLYERHRQPTLAGYLGWALFCSNPKEYMQRACALLDQAVESDPADPMLRFFLGQIEAHLGNWFKARDYFKQAERIFPRFEPATKALRNLERRTRPRSSAS